ncbi:signal peptidase I [Microbacterium bovistercoris]|uniref:Signal peptidase I n=1 Tax=Microbacterium bovistercoris TaxID=2293570 RepID=A0A371NXI5_9MICO|nr:signal peptidase I [Microbacterium bovistercoris]REJ08014.1 signal peptidase I [Microbacterium bovistercoris]
MTGEAEASRRESRLRRVTRSAWFHLILAFTVMGLILSFVAKPYVIPSGSMEQTLQIGDRVLVNRLAYVAAEPQVGDIVVFDAGPEWDLSPRPAEPLPKAVLRWIGEVTGFGPSGPHTLVKRVIGTPGQKVECCSADGRILVDGEPVDEPYVYEDLPFTPGENDCTTTPRSARCFDAVVVPEDSYLMLGDHRSNSADSAVRCRTQDAESACWRWAKRDQLVGRAVVILWPPGRWTAF